MNEIANLVGSLGFPIVCVGACGYFIWFIIRSEREEKYIETINNFSVVMDKVNENLINNNKRLEYIENKLDEVCFDESK